MGLKRCPKQSKSTKRVLKKLDAVLQVCSKVLDDQQLICKKMKQMKKENRQIFRLLEEKSCNPQAQPIPDFQLQEASSSWRSHGSLRRLQLSFEYKLPCQVFTADLIHATDDDGINTNVRVVLLDESGSRVYTSPLSSLKLEIFVAYGDLEEESEVRTWTAKELEASRVPARKEIGSLLLGKCVGTMVQGCCTFNDLKFGDNSSWVPSKTFSLVAKVADTAQISADMVYIKPAISESIRVKDHRGKSFEKRSVPSREDEVWRMNRIRKDGPYHRRLEAQGIRTVEDFLRRYYMDESSLRTILGAKDGEWATIVENAKASKPNNQGFMYSSHESKAELVFNCFYQLVGVSFDDQSYRSLQDLTEDEKSQAEQLRLSAIEDRAFEDQTRLVQINSLSGFICAKTNPEMAPDPNPQLSADPPPQQVEYVSELEGFLQESIIWANIVPEGQPEGQMNVGYPVLSASVSHPTQQNHHLNDAPMNDQATQVERSIDDQGEASRMPNVPSASGAATEGPGNDLFDVSWFMNLSRAPDAFSHRRT